MSDQERIVAESAESPAQSVERSEPAIDEQMAANESRLDAVYRDQGVNIDVDETLLKQVRSIKDAIVIPDPMRPDDREVGIAQLAELKRKKSPEVVAEAESLLDLMEADEVLRNVVEARREVGYAQESAQKAQENYAGLTKSYEGQKAELATLEQSSAELLTKTVQTGVFKLEEFQVNASALDYERRSREGQKNMPIVGFNFDDLEKVEAYLERRNREPGFDAAAQVYEDTINMGFAINRTRRRLEEFRNSRDGARGEVERTQKELTEAVTRLGQFIRVAELQQQQLAAELERDPQAALTTDREVEIALSATQDLGSPRVYRVLEARAGEVTLFRDDFDKDGNPAGVRKTIPIEEFRRIGGRLVKPKAA